MEQRLWRRQDDDSAPGPAYPSLRHHRNRQRQLPVQEAPIGPKPLVNLGRRLLVKVGRRLTRMDLVKWIADDIFVADIAGSRFEVTVRDQPQVLFTLKAAAVEHPSPRPAIAAARTPTTPRSELDAPSTRTAPQPVFVRPGTTQEPTRPPASLATGQKVHKWVAKDGTVTYSDRPPPN